MSRDTADISQLCGLAWYDWIMYHPGTIDYPDEPSCLGKYLISGIDVGPAMTTNILQHNGERLYRSMNHPLTIEEQADITVQQDMVTFRENAEECQGVKLTHAKLEEVNKPDTLEYVLYADEDQNKMMLPDLDEEITPEVGDEYKSQRWIYCPNSHLSTPHTINPLWGYVSG